MCDIKKILTNYIEFTDIFQNSRYLIKNKMFRFKFSIYILLINYYYLFQNFNIIVFNIDYNTHKHYIVLSEVSSVI